MTISDPKMTALDMKMTGLDTKMKASDTKMKISDTTTTASDIKTRVPPCRLLKKYFGHKTVIRWPKTVFEELVYIEILSWI